MTKFYCRKGAWIYQATKNNARIPLNDPFLQADPVLTMTVGSRVVWKIGFWYIEVSTDYAWDGPSIPGWRWISEIPFLGKLLEKWLLGPSLKHDVGYQGCRRLAESIDTGDWRGFWDNEFLIDIGNQGTNAIETWFLKYFVAPAAYRVVRRFGRQAASAESIKPVMTVRI